MDYSQFLFQVGNYTWLGYILAFAAVFKADVADRSYCYGAAVVIVSNLVMQIVEPALVALSEYDKQLVRQLWYPTWAGFALLSICSIYLLHKKSQCTIGFVALSIVYGFSALGVLQALRYFDYLVFQTDGLRILYRYGVNAINIGFVFVLLTPVLSRLIQKWRAKPL